MFNNNNKINIYGTSNISCKDDPFYRYKRREFKILQQKTKISIQNMNEVASDLKRDPLMIIDYLKKKNGMTFTYKNGIFTTTKKISKEILDHFLQKYIEEYVLCKKCKYPEVDLKIENKNISAVCRCCSNVYVYKKNDIINNFIKRKKRITIKST